MRRKPVDLLNEIRMSRSAVPQLSAFLVEGRTDSGFLRKLTCPKRCRLYDAQKVLARQTAELATKVGVKGVVALVDRDHDHLLGRLSSCESLVYTDENDLEITIMLSSAFEAFLHEYLDHGEQDKILAEIGSESIGHFLLQSAGVIGAFRYLSAKHNWDLRFRDLEATEVFDLDRMKVNPDRLVDHIFRATLQPKIRKDDAVDALQSILQANQDVSVFATGHDATRILALLLSSCRWTSYQLSVDSNQIEREMRLCFSPEYFRRTRMYNALQRWEQSESPHSVFAEVAC